MSGCWPRLWEPIGSQLSSRYFGARPVAALRGLPRLTAKAFEPWRGLFDPALHDQCVREIADGIRHLHLLGIIHNDINPFNIMLDDQNTVRIIDLDSAKWEKQELCCKKGTEGWTQEGMTYAERENDYYGLRKISEHLGVTAGISF